MTRLPSLLVPVFMCWLGYSRRASLWLAGMCVCWRGGWTKTLFCFVAADVLAHAPTKPSANLCSCFQVWNLPVFSPSVSLALSVCLYNHASFCIGSPAYWISQTHRFTRCISAPHLNNQLSYLDTVSSEHTDLSSVCVWAERTVHRDRLMSPLSKWTEVIGQDIRKPANPVQACLLTHTFVSQAARQTLLPGLRHM